MQKPNWLQRGVWAIHRSTGTAFQPQCCTHDRILGQTFLTDLGGDRYPASECSLLTPEDLPTVARLVTAKGAINTIPTSAGLRVGQWLVEPPSEGLKAARSLAKFFSGAIASEVVNA